jgi:tyrosinase
MTGSISRRHLLQLGTAGIAGALIPFPEWLSRYGAADAQTPLIRWGASTPQGSAMIAKYRTAVDVMMHGQMGQPCSWVFQWYTHNVRGDRTKAAEVGTLPAGQQPLANEMWDTCQAHSNRPLRFFLPWHRMYVYFFERIVRKACGDPTFTLPYWDYLSAGQRALPAPFWNNTASPLWRQNRKTVSNNGQPIDTGYPPNAINAACLNQADYLPSASNIGFNSAINSSPHGDVHGMVGNSLGMGNVPWAANDPIFWLHHCNIDRMWASWNNAGRTNPPDASWQNQQFVFADENCNRVQVKVSDFGAIAPLNYRYDRLLPMLNRDLLERLRNLRLIAVLRRPPLPLGDPLRTGIPLGRRPVTVSLSPAAGATPMFTARTLSTASTVRLNLRNLRTNVVPDTLYDVYLNLPEGAPPAMARRYYAGSITFFDAMGANMASHAGHMESEDGPSYALDVTALVRRLRISGPVAVTIVPHDEPAAEAQPVIGTIELVAG